MERYHRLSGLEKNRGIDPGTLGQSNIHIASRVSDDKLRNAVVTTFGYLGVLP